MTPQLAENLFPKRSNEMRINSLAAREMKILTSDPKRTQHFYSLLPTCVNLTVNLTLFQLKVKGQSLKLV